MTTPVLPVGADNRSIVERVNAALAGRLNTVTSVTLTAGATSTTLTDPRISAVSYLGLTPLSATAAAATSLYVSARTKGAATLTHNNTADTDRTFSVLIIG